MTDQIPRFQSILGAKHDASKPSEINELDYVGASFGATHDIALQDSIKR